MTDFFKNNRDYDDNPAAPNEGLDTETIGAIIESSLKNPAFEKAGKPKEESADDMMRKPGPVAHPESVFEIDESRSGSGMIVMKKHIIKRDENGAIAEIILDKNGLDMRGDAVAWEARRLKKSHDEQRQMANLVQIQANNAETSDVRHANKKLEAQLLQQAEIDAYNAYICSQAEFTPKLHIPVGADRTALDWAQRQKIKLPEEVLTALTKAKGQPTRPGFAPVGAVAAANKLG